MMGVRASGREKKRHIGIPVFRPCQGHWDLSTYGCTVCLYFLGFFLRYHEDKIKCICSFATFFFFFVFISWFLRQFPRLIRNLAPPDSRSVFFYLMVCHHQSLKLSIRRQKKETNTYDLEVKGSRFKSYRLSRPPSYSIPNSIDPPDPFNTHQYTAKFVTTTNWSNALQVQMVHSHQRTPIFAPHCTMDRDQPVIRSFLCVDDRMRPFKSIKQPRVETGTP